MDNFNFDIVGALIAGTPFLALGSIFFLTSFTFLIMTTTAFSSRVGMVRTEMRNEVTTAGTKRKALLFLIIVGLVFGALSVWSFNEFGSYVTHAQSLIVVEE